MPAHNAKPVEYSLREKTTGRIKHGHQEEKYRVPDAAAPRNPELYNQIELMSFVLEGLTYNDLYSDPGIKLDALLHHIATRIGATLRFLLPQERGELMSGLQKARRWIRSDKETEDVTLRQMAIYRNSVAPFDRIYDQVENVPHINKLCIPFFYTAMPADYLDDEFLPKFGPLELFDLYTYTKEELFELYGADIESRHTRRAFAVGMFVPAVHVQLGFPDRPLPNGFCCDGDGCGGEDANSYCNLAENGGCSAASTSC